MVRGLASCRMDGIVRHYFGSYADPATPAGKAPYVVLDSLRWAPQKGSELPPNTGGLSRGRLWLVGTTATEVLRASAAGPFSPLTRNQIDGTQALPADSTRLQNRSLLKVQISVNRWSGQQRFFMDSNQWAEVESDQVTVQLLAPVSFREIAPTAAQIGIIPTLDGLVGDDLMGASIIEIEESTTLNEVTFTENVFVATGTTGVIRVPPYAKTVTIYQNGLGVASVAWLGNYGAAALTVGEINAQTIPFIVGARKSEPEEILPDVTHLLSDIAVGDRFFTLRWGIVP